MIVMEAPINPRAKRERHVTQKRLQDAVAQLQLRVLQAEREKGVLLAHERALREMITQQASRFQSITDRSPLPGQEISLSTVDSLTAAEIMIKMAEAELAELKVSGVNEQPSIHSGGSTSSQGSRDIAAAAAAEGDPPGAQPTYVDTILTQLQTQEQLQHFKNLSSTAYRKTYCDFAETVRAVLRSCGGPAAAAGSMEVWPPSSSHVRNNCSMGGGSDGSDGSGSSSGSSSVELQLLEQLLDDFMVVMLGVQLMAPETAWDAAGRNVATGEPTVVPEELWPRAAAKLGLTLPQKEKLAGAYSHFRETQALAAAERQQLLQQLQAETALHGTAAAGGGAGTSASDLHKATPEEHEQRLQQLERSLRRVKESGVAVINMCLNTMTKQQIILMVAEAYPYWADGVALSKVMYEELNRSKAKA